MYSDKVGLHKGNSHECACTAKTCSHIYESNKKIWHKIRNKESIILKRLIKIKTVYSETEKIT